MWSGGPLTPGDQSNLAAASSLTFTGPGPNDFTFHIPDLVVDFLAAGETLTGTYNVTVAGGGTEQAVVIVFGTEDAPKLAPDVSGPHTTTEIANATNNSTLDQTAPGTLHFADVDLNDTHTVSKSLVSATWSGGGTLPSGLQTVLGNALLLTPHDSTHAVFGSVDFTFSAADKNFDFLAAGETLTVTYDVTVADNFGVSSTQQVTVVITGTEDAPVMAPHAHRRGYRTSSRLCRPDRPGYAHLHRRRPHRHTSGVGRGQGHGLLERCSVLSAVKPPTARVQGPAVGFYLQRRRQDLQLLAQGETLTVTYNVTLKDSQNVTSATSSSHHRHRRRTGAGAARSPARLPSDQPIVPIETAPGTLTFTDVDLTDTHLVSAIFKATDYSSQLGLAQPR